MTSPQSSSGRQEPTIHQPMDAVSQKLAAHDAAVQRSLQQTLYAVRRLRYR